MTQAALGTLLGRPQSFVAKYEQGERYVDAVEFIAICLATKSDPHEIMRRVEMILKRRKA